MWPSAVLARVAVCLLVFVSYSLYTSRDSRAQSLTAEAAASCEIPIYGDGSAMIIQVMDGKKTYQFLLDTGSAFTFFDASTYRTQMKPFRDRGPNAENRSAELRSLDSDRIENPGNLRVAGRLPIQSNPLYLADLSSLSEAHGEKLDGVLGCDFLNHCTVEVDADASKLRISQQEPQRKGQCIEFVRDEFERPVINATLREFAPAVVDAAFLIDTGKFGIGGVSLKKDLFQSYVDAGLLTVEGRRQTAQVMGVSSERIGNLPRFQIWRDVENIQVREKSGPQFNLLGLAYLMQFNFTFDFPNSKLYLSPRRTKNNLLHMKDFSGLGLLRAEEDVYVRMVYSSSPASNADIREGDIVLSIDGVATQDLRMVPLRASLCDEGKIVRLKMRRGTRQWDVDLKLAEWRQKPVTAKDFE